VDGGKREAGRVPADVASRFPGSITVTGYAEFVALYLNTERVRAVMVADAVLAGRITGGDEKFPREWKKLLDGDE